MMATVTHVTTIDHVAKMLGEDQDLLEAIVYNDDSNRPIVTACQNGR